MDEEKSIKIQQDYVRLTVTNYGFGDYLEIFAEEGSFCDGYTFAYDQLTFSLDKDSVLKLVDFFNDYLKD